MIKDRIEKILEEYNLTATELADKLDVQRSSISHITSGRNKPSAQFIQNLLNEFPEIDARWFITGEKNMFASTSQSINHKTKELQAVKQLSLLDETVENIEKQENPTSVLPVNQRDNEEKSEDPPKNQIDKIIVFYSDKTFETYRPRS